MSKKNFGTLHRGTALPNKQTFTQQAKLYPTTDEVPNNVSPIRERIKLRFMTKQAFMVRQYLSKHQELNIYQRVFMKHHEMGEQLIDRSTNSPTGNWGEHAWPDSLHRG